MGAAAEVKRNQRLVVHAILCFVAPASVVGSPEFIELICAQGGNELTGQLRHGSRSHQLQPAVDTPSVAHPLRAEPPLRRVEEIEAQYRRVAGVALLLGPQPLCEARARLEREEDVSKKVGEERKKSCPRFAESNTVHPQHFMVYHSYMVASRLTRESERLDTRSGQCLSSL